MVRLEDVAQALGLSLSTVSRALSDPDKVNPRTRERVRAKVREVGYVPNRTARSLSVGRTGMIGLVAPDIANPFFPPIIKSVQSRAGRKDHAVLIADTDEHAADEFDCASLMRERADGLILISPRTPRERMDEFLKLAPIVVVNRQVDNMPSVLLESTDGVNEAVEHLVALGHRAVCYLGGPRRSWGNQNRRDALRVACETYGIEFIEFGPFEPRMEAGVRAADLVQARGITAVIAFDDVIALGVMTRLAERNVQVGRDVSVIGIDDSPMSGMAYPTLTSIHVPGKEAGVLAVDLLLDLINGIVADPPPLIKLETRLVIRNSTGPAG